MYCEHCGAYNEDTDKFCGVCGKPAAQQTSYVPVVNVDSSAVVMPNRIQLEDGYFFKDIGFAKKLLIYALGVFLTFAVAMIVFGYSAPEYFSDLVSYISRFFY